MPEHTAERRRFHRIATDKPVILHIADVAYPGTVRDLSLRGMLFDVQGSWRPEIGMPIAASVQLDDALCCIEMNGKAVHVEGNRVGLRCSSLDVESASRLRRMVELNLDDPRLLERDLAEMLAG